jgi:hypothetical protein
MPVASQPLRRTNNNNNRLKTVSRLIEHDPLLKSALPGKIITTDAPHLNGLAKKLILRLMEDGGASTVKSKPILSVHHPTCTCADASFFSCHYFVCFLKRIAPVWPVSQY